MLFQIGETAQIQSGGWLQVSELAKEPPGNVRWVPPSCC